MAGEEVLTQVLGWIIAGTIIVGAIWRVALWQNNRLDTRDAARQKMWEDFAQQQAKNVKEQFENSMEVLRGELLKVDLKMSKQLRRQNRRSDFTNSNVQKVRLDSLNIVLDLHRIQKALVDKGMAVNNDNVDTLFEREIKRKRKEIEDDATAQLPLAYEDEEDE